MTTTRVLLTLFLFLLSFKSFSKSVILESLNYYEGCYIGNDESGVEVYGHIARINPSEGIHEYHINGQQVPTIIFSFTQPKLHSSIITQAFDQGNIISSRELNGTYTYRFDGDVKRTALGNFLSQMNHKTIITIKKKLNLYTFNIYQNDNSDFFSDMYRGLRKSNLVKFMVQKVDC